jgi:hypothetical protein
MGKAVHATVRTCSCAQGNILRSFVLDTNLPLDEWHVPLIVEEVVSYNL